jgi:actin
MEKQLFDIKSNQKQISTNNNQNSNNPNGVKGNQGKEEKIDDKNMLKFLENKMKEMETEFDVEDNIVIDLGSAFTKIGFSGEDLPRAIVPSIYSSLRPDPNKTEINLEKNPHLYGYDIFNDKDKHMYNVKYLKQGDHEEVIDHDFYYLLDDYFKRENISTSDYNIIINASPVKNKKNIMALTRLFLDEFNFKGLSIINSSSLALFATGRTSGLVVDCGESQTQIVPIYEGFPLFHSLNISSIGGKHVSDMFIKGILECYPEFDAENIISIREIKEKMSFVPYLKEADSYIRSDKDDVLREEQRLYKLPDGEKIIEIPKKYRINAAEILFK